MLAHWLTQHRTSILSGWIAQLDTVPALVAALPSHDAMPPADIAISTRDTALEALYDALAQAAAGHTAPLNKAFTLLQDLCSDEGENELQSQIELFSQLRHVLFEELFAVAMPAPEQRLLLDQTNCLIDDATRLLAQQWSAKITAIRQQLEDNEHFAQRLAASAEQADQIALQLHNMNTLAGELAASLNYADLVQVVGSKLGEVLDAASIMIWLSSNGFDLYPAYSSGAPIAPGLVLNTSCVEDAVVCAYREHTTVFTATPHAASQGSWYQQGSAVFAVPLIAQDIVIGVIAVQDADPETTLSPHQRDFIHSVANQSAIALQNARLYAEVRGFNTELERRITDRTSELQVERDMLSTLNQITLEMNTTLDLDFLLQNSLFALADLVGVTRGSIMLLEEDTQHLVDRAMLGRPKESTGFLRFPMGQGIAGWVAQNRQSTRVDDVTKDKRWVDLPQSEFGRKQQGSMALAPLIVQGEVTGVISLSHDDTNYFNDNHMRLLDAAAVAIALGINNAKLYDAIQQESMRRGEMLQKERRASSQSNAILQSLSDGVIMCDIDGRVLTANLAAERVLTMPLEHLLTIPLPDLLQKLLLQRSKELPIEQVLRGATGFHSYAVDFLRARHTIRVTLDPVATDRGTVIGAVAVFRDITREVESERLKDEFIGTVSHELRTPMTSIKGFTQLLAMGSLGPVNEPQKEFLKTIQINSERMISIINDLLDITKIEAGSIELDLRPVHVAEALGNIATEVQGRIKERNHELQIRIPPALPLVRADAKRFDQILYHLVMNAIRYTPNGGSITIAAHEIALDSAPAWVIERVNSGRYVQIDVTDNGVGIATEEQELIFNRFYRTENLLKIEAGGTGLGLSLVRPLVRLFGGQIWLSSMVGEGSTFSFIVPVM